MVHVFCLMHAVRERSMLPITCFISDQGKFKNFKNIEYT